MGDPRKSEHRRGRALLRYVWRDLWLIVTTAIALGAVIYAAGSAGDATTAAEKATLAADRSDEALREIQEGRRTATLDGCRRDQAQDNVLRALIESSLRQADARYPGPGHRDDFGRTSGGRLALAEQLLAPLGGLRPTSAMLEELCQQRLVRGNLARGPTSRPGVPSPADHPPPVP